MKVVSNREEGLPGTWGETKIIAMSRTCWTINCDKEDSLSSAACRASFVDWGSPIVENNSKTNYSALTIFY